MNLKHKFFFFLLITTVLSCKKEIKVVETEKVVPEVKSNYLVFEADLKTNQPDVFSLYANNMVLNNSQLISIKVEEKLSDNNTEKTLRFEFPEKLKPGYQLFLNLGAKNEKEVKLENISISYGDTKFEISSENMMEYFTTNKFVKYNSERKALIVKKVDNKLNPLLMVRRKILDSLQSL